MSRLYFNGDERTILTLSLIHICDDISIFREIVLNSILPLIQVAAVMAQKYDVVVTNPPYMGAGGMSGKLSEFVKKEYPCLLYTSRCV